MKTKKVIEAAYDLGYDKGWEFAQEQFRESINHLTTTFQEAGDTANRELEEMTAARDGLREDRDKFELLWKQEQERNSKLRAEVENGDEMQRVMTTELQDLRKHREHHEREANRTTFIKANFDNLRAQLENYGSTGVGDWGEIMDLVDQIGQRVV